MGGKKSDLRFGERCIMVGREKKSNFKFWDGYIIKGRKK
jgi:hypothetical protein